jgi:YD repeat-containing protein
LELIKEKLVMKYFLKITLVILSFTVIYKSESQSYGLPKILPPSPEASAIFRVMDYTLDYSSGIPNIQVPLYEVKSGSLTVPISISYNAGGRRVYDVTGPVGLGWSLNAGGIISRTIYGKPDDQSDFPYVLKPAASMRNKDDYDYLASLYYRTIGFGEIFDSEHDIFSYYVGSYSGKFLADRTGQNLNFKLLPFQPLKILKDNTPGAAFPSTILDDKGIKYEFLTNELSQTQDQTYGNPISSKLISFIISPNKQDTISFTYVTKLQKGWGNTEQMTVQDNNLAIQNISYSQTYALNNNYREYAVQRISEIKFRGGKVKFLLHPSSDRIKTIQIFNERNEIIRVIELQSSPLDSPLFMGTEQNYKLDAVLFQTSQSKTIENYLFEYNASYKFSTKDRDYWGFVNGFNNNVAYPTWYNIPVETQYGIESTINIYGGIRSASGLASATGVLKKITFPTGGTTEFAYEGNQFMRLDNVLTTGGIRVRQIKTDDLAGNIKYKTYKYGSNECGYGISAFNNFLIEDFASEKRHFTQTLPKPETPISGYSLPLETGFRKRVYSSEIIPDISDLVNTLVVYPEVTEYNGTVYNITGKTIYQYDIPQGNITASYYPVPVFEEPALVYSGSTNFRQFTYDDQIKRRHIHHYEPWKTAELRNTQIFKNNGNNSYTLTKEVTNNYNWVQTETVKGTHIYKFIEFGTGENQYRNNLNELSGVLDFHLPVFQFADYDITVGIKKMAYTRVNEYSNLGVISQSTDYTYNDNLLPSVIKRVSSKGEELTTKIKYPQDFIFDPVLGLLSQSMVNSNMINYPFEQSDLNGTNFLNGTKTIYYNWGSGIAPKTIQQKIGNSPYENIIQYHGYDSKGNLLSVSKENDIRISYLWDYNKTRPTAEVTNSDDVSIAYTSFEADGKGNWEFTGVPAADPTTPTGKMCYTLNSTTATGITKSGLNTATTYIVSYWTKNANAINITGTKAGYPVTGRKINNWTYCEHKVTGQSTISISGNGIIDELRLYPEKALMVTMTHEPLIGITSQCDANNRITYYEYDAFNRLVLIRDQDNHILKKICYNYAGKPENCLICTNFTPNWQSTTALRCQLGSCGTNTGYQEQELRDINICSPTYNQTQWVVGAYNSTMCPQQTCVVQLTSNNSQGNVGYTASYYNTSTGANYYFTVPGVTGLSSLGNIPAGTYNLTITWSDNFSYNSISSGCEYQTQTGNSPLTFYNISVSATSCNSITIGQ